MSKPPEKPPEETGRSRREAELEARVAELERLLARAGTGAGPARDRAAPRESEALYRAILESAIDTAIIAMDIAGRVTTWNEGARRIFGWTEAEMRGNPAHVFFTDEDCAHGVPEAEMRSALYDGWASDERWHRRKDGSRFWARGQMTPLKDADGTVQGFLKILRDRTHARQAEEALRRSEERFRAAVEAVEGIVWTTGANEEMTEVQPGWAALTGQTYEEYRGGGWAAAVHPEDLPPSIEAWNEAQRERRPFMVEQRVRRHDGAWRLFSVRAIPAFDRDGSVREWVGVHTDITELSEAEQALRESEARFRNMADHAPVMIWTSDRNSYCTYLNRAWYVFTGQTEAESLGFGWQSAIHPDDRAEAKEVLRAGKARREDVRLEYRLRRADGVYRWVIDASAPRFESDAYLGYVGSVIDITERREAEEVLRASETELRLVTDAMPALIGLIDEQERYRFANRYFETWFGVPPEEVQGRHVREVIGEEAYAACKPYIERTLAGETVAFEASLPHLDGSRRETETQYIPRRRADGRIDGYYSLGLDVTDRKRAEKHQRLLMRELSHRMKNTLATVQAIATQTLRNAASLDEAREALVARIITLGKAHDVLLGQAQENASIRDVVATALETHGGGEPVRFQVGGPDIQLAPKAGLALTLALHELATNAAKYGALSVSEGRIELDWSVDRPDDEAIFRLRWSEHGGPPVAPPGARGFGSRLIERSLAGEFGGVVDLRYERDGVVCTITAPLARLSGR